MDPRLAPQPPPERREAIGRASWRRRCRRASGAPPLPTCAILRREDRPDGSLGRVYLAFIDANGFSVPDELGGPPPPVVRHDCCHVLGADGIRLRQAV